MNDNLCIELTPKLAELNRTSDKIQLIHTHLNETNEYPKYNLSSFQKNTEQSLQLKKKANVLFVQKEQYDPYTALELYNACACFAECNSEELSIAYANRSAVYLQLELYERCLENIELVKKMDSYPTRLMDKLLQRERQCHSELAAGSASFNSKNLMDKYTFEPKLWHQPHSVVSGISETLELKENTKYGRFVITTKDINPGEIISIVAPYESELKKPYFYKRCAYCLSENQLSLIPCTGCTSAMFCNSKCMTDALESFHGIECPILGYVASELDSWPLAIRLSIRAFLSFDSVPKLIQFMDKYRTIKSTVFTPLPNDLTKDQILLHQICSLENNEAHMSSNALFDLYVSTSNVFNILMKFTRFNEICATDENTVNAAATSILIELLYSFHLIVKGNAHGMIQLSAGESNISYASGIFPFCSMLNHSCILNVERFYKNKQMVMVAVRSIKAGEQIFDNYG